MQANLESSSTVDSSYTAGDMTAGNVAPDFTRTVNVYDSQGGQQPITFSFVKTAANTWAYEASYAGASSNLSSANPIAEGTMTFNSDGTLANVNGASPASGNISLTIPWKASTSGLAPQTISVNMGTVGCFQRHRPSTTSPRPSTARRWTAPLRHRHRRDRRQGRHGDGAVLQRHVAGGL